MAIGMSPFRCRSRLIVTFETGTDGLAALGAAIDPSSGQRGTRGAGRGRRRLAWRDPVTILFQHLGDDRNGRSAVVQVLDDVPHRDHVERLRRAGDALDELEAALRVQVPRAMAMAELAARLDVLLVTTRASGSDIRSQGRNVQPLDAIDDPTSSDALIARIVVATTSASK
jgi:hypothetical protein